MKLTHAALLSLAGVAALALVLAPGAGAEPSAKAGGLVLHEYVPEPEASTHAAIDTSRLGPGKLPTQFHTGSTPIPRPREGIEPRKGEQAIAEGSSQAARQNTVQPDRETRHEGTLHYQAVFNPSVVPFKRLSVQDKVDAVPGKRGNKEFVLVVADASRRPVAVTKLTPAPDRKLFWGSVLIRRRSQEEVLPLPSVSPDMQIHGYETKPQGIKVTFFKDSADNFSVTARFARRFRLRFLVSSPKRYFHQAIPTGLTLADVPRDRRPQVPAEVARIAARMHRRMGITRSADLKEILDKLVSHHRSFEEGPLGLDTGNTYADLTLSQRGVCRHRSYAFVISAQALGIPARFVTNEAHAFVEAWIPRAGWLRIDLGGAANELNVSNAGDKQVHRPPDDSFPKPKKYGRNYSRLQGAVTGLSRRQRQGPTQTTGHGGKVTTRQRQQQDPGGTPSNTSEPDKGIAVSVVVDTAETRGRRGDRLLVRGRLLTGDGEPIRGRSVELLLRKKGRDDMVILGIALSKSDGTYVLATTIPIITEVGVYRVVAYSAADSKYRAAWSK